jgi:hypothetical protein
MKTEMRKRERKRMKNEKEISALFFFFFRPSPFKIRRPGEMCHSIVVIFCFSEWRYVRGRNLQDSRRAIGRFSGVWTFYDYFF